MRHSKHYIDGSPQSCSNHQEYGDNSVSIDIVVAPHVGITDEQIERGRPMEIWKMDHSKKMRLSEIPSLMVMQVMLWTAAWTELTVMLKHMEKGHMRGIITVPNTTYYERSPLTLPSSGPQCFKRWWEYLSRNQEYLHSEGYTQKELDKFRQALDDAIPPMHQVDDEERTMVVWCHPALLLRATVNK